MEGLVKRHGGVRPPPWGPHRFTDCWRRLEETLVTAGMNPAFRSNPLHLRKELRRTTSRPGPLPEGVQRLGARAGS